MKAFVTAVTLILCGGLASAIAPSWLVPEVTIVFATAAVVASEVLVELARADRRRQSQLPRE